MPKHDPNTVPYDDSIAKAEERRPGITNIYNRIRNEHPRWNHRRCKMEAVDEWMRDYHAGKIPLPATGAPHAPR